jgi:TAT (twin-arginine translocation) pathway signal sequence
MGGQNEDQTSRRKFLKGAGLVGAAAVTPAAANAVPQTEWSPEQVSKLEEIVRNFITNAQDANIQPLGSTLALMGHGSHNNEGASRSRAAPSRTAPTRK